VVTTAPPPACPSTLAGQLASTGNAAQLITVDTPSYTSTTATVALWQRSGRCWTEAAGPWTAWVGTRGVSDHHREGDGTTPTGAYGIGAVMYGIASDPGVHYQYHQLVCGDWWDEDPSSPQYNTFQHVPCGTNPPFGGNSEALWTETTAYQSFAVVDYNTNPVVPGAGSAVFVHYDTGGPTAGCVSLPAAQLATLLRWLQPGQAPRIVIGTDAEIRRF
jgi:L,D-peptidoglycan transpeptidase YkuD (ErfK/YbiS/YcfS/YnhG family)